MATAAVCHPLADSPLKTLPPAAASVVMREMERLYLEDLRYLYNEVAVRSAPLPAPGQSAARRGRSTAACPSVGGRFPAPRNGRCS
jgi:hypothetical protein